jgi:hypothetical protein
MGTEASEIRFPSTLACAPRIHLVYAATLQLFLLVAIYLQ